MREVDSLGMTALHGAARNAHPKIVAALLEADSAPDFVDARAPNGNTALIEAVSQAGFLEWEIQPRT